MFGIPNWDDYKGLTTSPEIKVISEPYRDYLPQKWLCDLFDVNYNVERETCAINHYTKNKIANCPTKRLTNEILNNHLFHSTKNINYECVVLMLTVLAFIYQKVQFRFQQWNCLWIERELLSIIIWNVMETLSRPRFQ